MSVFGPSGIIDPYYSWNYQARSIAFSSTSVNSITASVEGTYTVTATVADSVTGVASTRSASASVTLVTEAIVTPSILSPNDGTNFEGGVVTLDSDVITSADYDATIESFTSANIDTTETKDYRDLSLWQNNRYLYTQDWPNHKDSVSVEYTQYLLSVLFSGDETPTQPIRSTGSFKYTFPYDIKWKEKIEIWGFRTFNDVETHGKLEINDINVGSMLPYEAGLSSTTQGVGPRYLQKVDVTSLLGDSGTLESFLLYASHASATAYIGGFIVDGVPLALGAQKLNFVGDIADHTDLVKFNKGTVLQTSKKYLVPTFFSSDDYLSGFSSKSDDVPSFDPKHTIDEIFNDKGTDSVNTDGCFGSQYVGEFKLDFTGLFSDAKEVAIRLYQRNKLDTKILVNGKPVSAYAANSYQTIYVDVEGFGFNTLEVATGTSYISIFKIYVDNVELVDGMLVERPVRVKYTGYASDENYMIVDAPVFSGLNDGLPPTGQEITSVDGETKIETNLTLASATGLPQFDEIGGKVFMSTGLNADGSVVPASYTLRTAEIDRVEEQNYLAYGRARINNNDNVNPQTGVTAESNILNLYDNDVNTYYEVASSKKLEWIFMVPLYVKDKKVEFKLEETETANGSNTGFYINGNRVELTDNDAKFVEIDPAIIDDDYIRNFTVHNTDSTHADSNVRIYQIRIDGEAVPFYKEKVWFKGDLSTNQDLKYLRQGDVIQSDTSNYITFSDPPYTTLGTGHRGGSAEVSSINRPFSQDLAGANDNIVNTNYWKSKNGGDFTYFYFGNEFPNATEVTLFMAGTAPNDTTVPLMVNGRLLTAADDEASFASNKFSVQLRGDGLKSIIIGYTNTLYKIKVDDQFIFNGVEHTKNASIIETGYEAGENWMMVDGGSWTADEYSKSSINAKLGANKEENWVDRCRDDADPDAPPLEDNDYDLFSGQKMMRLFNGFTNSTATAYMTLSLNKTLRFDPPIRAERSLRLYVYNGSLGINGSNLKHGFGAHLQMSKFGENLAPVVNSLDYPYELETIKALTGNPRLYAIEVDGKILVDPRAPLPAVLPNEVDYANYAVGERVSGSNRGVGPTVEASGEWMGYSGNEVRLTEVQGRWIGENFGGIEFHMSGPKVITENFPTAGIQLECTDFATDPEGVDSLKSIVWNINGSDYKTTSNPWTPGSAILQTDTSYTVSVKHEGVRLGSSDRSTSIKFTTGSSLTAFTLNSDIISGLISRIEALEG